MKSRFWESVEEVRAILHKEIIIKTYENHISKESPRSGEFECPGFIWKCILGRAWKIRKDSGHLKNVPNVSQLTIYILVGGACMSGIHVNMCCKFWWTFLIVCLTLSRHQKKMLNRDLSPGRLVVSPSPY